jgi:hypothetical protein
MGASAAVRDHRFRTSRKRVDENAFAWPERQQARHRELPSNAIDPLFATTVAH